MNDLLDSLYPYPFERLNRLLADTSPNPDLPFISLSLGEPKHAPPGFLIDRYSDREQITESLMTYPLTRGMADLRSAIAGFITRRYQLGRPTSLSTSINSISDSNDIPNTNDIRGNTDIADNHLLPVNGTREALFSFAQACINPNETSYTLIPNPFYQIYEGAALLAGSTPVYLPCLEENNFIPDFDSIRAEVWEKTRLIYLCTPGNPTGSIMSLAAMQAVIRKSDQYNFVIASDECYSEIYADENNPPPGLLEACDRMGRHDFRNCVAFNSLSKRSNLPGLRSGFVAGDAGLINKFLLYRTYHGSAMPVLNQQISAAAWEDEAHVMANRAAYRQKFDAVVDILSDVLDLKTPDAGFYLWPSTPLDDEQFTQGLYKAHNIKVLPGSYLSRQVEGRNPGTNRVRIALVAKIEECIEAAQRLRSFIKNG